LIVRLLRLVLYLVIVAAVAWSVAALWIDGPWNRTLAAALGALGAAVSLAAPVMIRPWTAASVAAVVPVAVVLVWWVSISPSNDRNWQHDVARLPTAVIESDRIAIKNVRNAYPSPAAVAEHWETGRTTSAGSKASTSSSRTGGPRYIAHTIASWAFSDGKHVAVSIETRKERGEQVFLCRLRVSPELARALFLDYLAEINRLVTRPQWYNAVTHNCTTMIRRHAREVAPRNPFDWRILANGHVDELAYERRMVNTSLPFAELRRRSDITARARTAGGRPESAALVREGLPERPATD